jgi:hypothetical protein
MSLFSKLVGIGALLLVASVDPVSGEDDTCAAACFNKNDQKRGPPELPPATMAMDIATGNWKAQSLRSFVTTGLAAAMENLCAGNKFESAEVLAEATGLHPVATFRLLRFLATFDVCIEGGNRTFRLGPIGEVLTPNHPESVAGTVVWEASFESASLWNDLPLFLETNEKVIQNVFGVDSFWDYIGSKPAVLKVFQEAMTGYSNQEAVFLSNPDLSPTFDLSGFDSICDLGSAEGRLALALSKRFPEPSYILSDLPEAMERIDAASLPDKFTKAPVDFLATPVPRSDAYLLKHIIHDWNDDLSTRILENIKRANRDATVFIIEFGPQPGPNVPHLAKGFDMHMGVVVSGTERTQEEYNAVFEASGFEVAKIHLLAGGYYPLYVQEIRVRSTVSDS